MTTIGFCITAIVAVVALNVTCFIATLIIRLVVGSIQKARAKKILEQSINALEKDKSTQQRALSLEGFQKRRALNKARGILEVGKDIKVFPTALSDTLDYWPFRWLRIFR